MSVTTEELRALNARRPRRQHVAPAEPDEVTVARHVRHIAADPLLARYHRDREARVLETAAKRLGELYDDGVVDAVRYLAAQHRKGVAL